MSNAKDYQLKSPDGQLVVDVSVSNEIQFSVFYKDQEIISNSQIGLQLQGMSFVGKEFRVKKHKLYESNKVIKPIVANKDATITDNYKELRIEFRDHPSVTFRAYNDGVAYRFSSSYKKNITVSNELLNLQFKGETESYFPSERSMVSHYERMYEEVTLSDLLDSDLCSLPVLMKTDGVNVLFTETDVSDYPHMFLLGTNSNVLKAKHPGFVTDAKPAERGSDRSQIITSADYIAQTKGKRDFPWRVMIISDDDKDLVESNLAYQLAAPNKIDDYSWIKPGKVAWDWYNANNIYGVDFKAGINTDTYKYYIDFASKYGLEYIILDEGWSKSTTEIDASQSDIVI